MTLTSDPGSSFSHISATFSGQVCTWRSRQFTEKPDRRTRVKHKSQHDASKVIFDWIFRRPNVSLHERGGRGVISPDTFSFPPSNHLILPWRKSQSCTVWNGLIQLSLWRAAAAQKRSLLETEKRCSSEGPHTSSKPAASGMKAAKLHFPLLRLFSNRRRRELRRYFDAYSQGGHMVTAEEERVCATRC